MNATKAYLYCECRAKKAQENKEHNEQGKHVFSTGLWQGYQMAFEEMKKKIIEEDFS